MKKILILIMTTLYFEHAFASNDVTNTVTQNTISQNTSAQTAIVGSAKEWNLTDKEWNQYIKLMQGTSGKYYSHLNPIEVLGINAESDQELNYFAEIAVKHEHEKIDKELRYNRAFSEAAKRLYTDEPIIKPFDISPYTPVPKNYTESASTLQSGDHLVLFTDIKEKSSTSLAVVINRIQSNEGLVLDVYCINAADDNAIRSWAKSNNIPKELVTNNRITLNNDNGKFKKLAKEGVLPYMLLVRNGKSKQVNMEVL